MESNVVCVPGQSSLFILPVSLTTNQLNFWPLSGDCLVKSDESMTPLTGTYTRNGYIYASIAGTVRMTSGGGNAVSGRLID